MSAHQHRLENLQRGYERFVQEEKAKGSSVRGCGQRFAEKLSISPKLLSNLLHEQKPVGTALARRFERALGMDSGRFDQAANSVTAESEIEATFLRNAMLAWRGSDAAGRSKLQETVSNPMILGTGISM